MTDISETLVPKSDQINADDLIGGPMTITVDRVVVKRGDDQPVDVHTVETPGRAYRPSKTMRKLIAQAWGTDSANWTGKAMTLYRNPKIRFGKEEVGGIEISAMSHIDQAFTVALTVSRGKKRSFHVEVLQPPQPQQQQGPDIDGYIQQANGEPEKLEKLLEWAKGNGAPENVLQQISAHLEAAIAETTGLPGGDAA